MNLVERFRHARRAAVPLVGIETPDPASTIRSIAEAIGTNGTAVPIVQWDLMRGLLPVNGEIAEKAIKPTGDPGADRAALPRDHDGLTKPIMQGIMVIRSKAERFALESFRYTWNFCWACGWQPGLPDDTNHRWLGLQLHHITKPGRVHEAWNFTMLCACCHLLAEGNRIVVAGKVLPKLEFEHVLWLKRRHDPENWDPAELQKHTRAGRKLPEPTPPPAWHLVQYQIWRRILPTWEENG